MFIPVGTDRPPKHPPIAAPLLIGLNIAVAVLGQSGIIKGPGGLSLVEWGWLDPEHFHWINLITSMFLHDPGSIWHLVGNMLFLWVFGCAVEGRLGSIGFAAFYLVAGAASGLAHMATSSAPAIGASGAIAGVVGAFLAFFPRANIRVLGLLFMFGVFSVPSVWFVGLYFAIDLVHQIWVWMGRDFGNVAYSAHLGGYLFGFGVGILLLAFKILPRDDYDAFYLFKQYRRRAELRAVNREQATSIWASGSPDMAERMARARRRKSGDAPVSAAASPTVDLRLRIDAFLRQQDRHGAAAAYCELKRLDPAAVLTEDRQLDVANQLYAEGHWDPAAAAYEAFLASYRISRHRDEVTMILGLLYTRKIPRTDRAKELLLSIRERMRDEAHAALIEQLLAELPS